MVKANNDFLTPPPTADPLSPEATMAPNPAGANVAPGAAAPSAGMPGTTMPNATAPNAAAASATPNPAASAAPSTAPTMGANPTATSTAVPTTPGMPPAASTAPLPGDSQKRKKIIIIVVIVVLSLLAATFIGLFIWKAVEYDRVSTDVEGQKAVAVSDAVNENTVQLENEFAIREQYPYRTFSAPDDYGGVGFEYPKTWSAYVAKSAQDNKGDFEAYLNPGRVEPVSATTINALRVTIKTQTFEKTIAEYDKLVEKGEMTVTTETLNNEKYKEVIGESYNLYRGQLPSKLRGAVAVFKVRDKSVILQTDAEDFIDTGNDCVGFSCPVLSTMHYNK